MTDSQKLNAPQLEPALESVLRDADADEEIIMAFRVEDIMDPAVLRRPGSNRTRTT